MSTTGPRLLGALAFGLVLFGCQGKNRLPGRLWNPARSRSPTWSSTRPPGIAGSFVDS